MLTIVCKRGVVNCKRYFREDYVLDDGMLSTSKSRWCGRAADRLGLTGPVTERQFNAMCDNVHPHTGEQLTPRMKANRRIGYDFCFSPPKSVSVMLYVGGDEGIAEAMREAVADAMSKVEESAFARVRRDGTMEDRQTSNMVWAQFEHHTSRPVGGSADPQTHIHVMVFNATHDSVEDRFKAVQMGPVVKDAPYFEGLFRGSLAWRLLKLGYTITECDVRGQWEIAGVPRSVIDEFSKRARAINKTADELGYETDDRRAKVGPATRQSKARAHDLASLTREWVARMTDEELARVSAVATGRAFIEPVRADPQKLKEVVERTSRYVFARRSVVKVNYFIAVALDLGAGRVTEQQVRDALKSKDFRVAERNSVAYVTRRVDLELEQELVSYLKAGIGKFRPRGTARDVSLTLAQRLGLADISDYAAARFASALSSSDQVIALIAHSEAERSALRNNLVVCTSVSGNHLLLTPTVRAKDQARKELPQVPAATLASFLSDKQLQKSLSGGVAMVTHAELVGSETGLRLMQAAAENRFRVDLLAVRERNRPPQRGSLLDLAYRHSTLATDYRGESQWTVRRNAVDQSLSVEPLVSPTARATNIREVGNVAHTAAAEYVKHTRQKDTISLVASTPDERIIVTDHVRGMLTRRKRLGKSKTREILEATEVASDVGQKANGLVAVPLRKFKHGAVPGIRSVYKPGEEWRVRVDALGKLIASNGSRIRVLPSEELKSFAFFAPRKIEIASGDKIRLSRDLKAHSRLDLTTNHKLRFGREPRHTLCAGRTYDVKRVLSGGRLLLKNGAVIPKGFKFYSHAYVSSPRDAQATPANHVLFVVTPDQADRVSGTAVKAAASSARKSFQVLTSAAVKTQIAIAREDAPLTAMSLLEQPAQTTRKVPSPPRTTPTKKRQIERDRE